MRAAFSHSYTPNLFSLMYAKPKGIVDKLRLISAFASMCSLSLIALITLILVGCGASKVPMSSGESTGGTPQSAPTIDVAVTPANASIPAGATQQFVASVTGTSNTAVTWTVAGAGCSGSGCGTISSSGLYTAPMSIPSPASVTITATSVEDATKSASAAVTLLPASHTTYYLAPAANGGNDSNNGLSPNAPWRTPNHSVNCGDVILAAASTAYADTSFQTGKWGTVTCAAGNDVAWLKCATFDTCKINSTSGYGAFWVDKSYWGVQGWEVTTSGTNDTCFSTKPNYTTPVNIHHIIFANDIANSCGEGFSVNNRPVNSVDYVIMVGNISYNGSRSATTCNSGISIYQPVASDTNPGTHIFVAGNISYDNMNPNPCAGAAPTDGEGIIIDTLDWSQSSGTPYTQQVVVENNLLFFNGGRGLLSFNNYSGTSWAKVYILNNTAYGNELDSAQKADSGCSEVSVLKSFVTEVYRNLAEPTVATGCSGNTVDAFYVAEGNATDLVYANFGYSSLGNNTGSGFSSGFSFGPNNLFGTDPQFANPSDPGAPSCGGTANTVACMATTIANFTPTNAAAIGYGYQPPSSTSVYDPLFPQWLCNVNLPSGLVTMGCLTAR